MTGERSAGWVRRWVGLYTRGLPDDVRRDRADEIESDVWSQLAEAGADRAVGNEILARLVFGIPADLWWRLEQGGAQRPVAAEPNPTMFARVIAATAIVGGVLWFVWMIPSLLMGNAAWSGQLAYVMMASTWFGTLALSLAMFSLIFANVDRLRPGSLVLSLLGAAGGLLLLVGMYQVAVVFLPIGSAILMLELNRIGAIGTRLARLHATFGIAIVALVLLALSNPQPTGIAAPWAIVIGLLFATYDVSWVAIGWALRRGTWLPEELVAEG